MSVTLWSQTPASSQLDAGSSTLSVYSPSLLAPLTGSELYRLNKTSPPDLGLSSAMLPQLCLLTKLWPGPASTTILCHFSTGWMQPTVLQGESVSDVLAGPLARALTLCSAFVLASTPGFQALLPPLCHWLPPSQSRPLSPSKTLALAELGSSS